MNHRPAPRSLPRARRRFRALAGEQLELRALLVSDFGDAPDTSAGTGPNNYQTLLANSGPSHVLDFTASSLFLGARVDSEANAAQNAAANGDDLAILPDDEDGVIEPAQDLLLTLGTAPVVRLRATNTIFASATLFGWIDYNRDGVFENASERASVVVPLGTQGVVTLAFPQIPAGLAAGPTYARFRLGASTLADDATGSVIGGEVEDYPATVLRPSGGIADSAKTIKIGNNLNGGPALGNFDEFATSLAAIGDFDGDGIGDLAVGAEADATGGTRRGAVYVVLMNADGTAKSTTKIANDTGGGPTFADSDFFGRSVSSLGDLDGDGVTDLAVGARGDDTGGSATGAVHVLLLNANGTVKSSVKIASGIGGGTNILAGSFFGSSLASLGDMDGDGISDLAVGADADDTGAGGNTRGAVHILFLNANGTAKSGTKIAHETNGGPTLASNVRFGTSVASLGDLDGDGITDLAVGATQDDTGAANGGAVFVLFLNANGIVKDSTKIADAASGAPVLKFNDNFGSAVASMGDLDGDGVTDLAVGATGDDTGGNNRGAAYLLFMKTDGTAKSSTKLAHNTNGGPTVPNDDLFGISLASPGDLDGDGLPELTAGTPIDGSGAFAIGAIQVLFLKPVNQAPSFIKGPNQDATDEDTAHLFPGWATALSAGPGETGQTLTFNVSVPAAEQGLFKVLPAVNSTTGNLTFTPQPNAKGAATVTVTLIDNGGSPPPNQNTSSPQTFTISIDKPHPWFNAARPLDVDNSGQTAPFDALLVINYLNAGFPALIPPNAAIGGGPGFLDTTRNNEVAPLDALDIINALNAGLGGEGEGSGERVQGSGTQRVPGVQDQEGERGREGEGEKETGSVEAEWLALLAHDVVWAQTAKRRRN